MNTLCVYGASGLPRPPYRAGRSYLRYYTKIAAAAVRRQLGCLRRGGGAGSGGVDGSAMDIARNAVFTFRFVSRSPLLSLLD